MQVLPREFYQTLTAQKKKFSIKNFLSNCEQIRNCELIIFCCAKYTRFQDLMYPVYSGK